MPLFLGFSSILDDSFPYDSNNWSRKEFEVFLEVLSWFTRVLKILSAVPSSCGVFLFCWCLAFDINLLTEAWRRDCNCFKAAARLPSVNADVDEVDVVDNGEDVDEASSLWPLSTFSFCSAAAWCARHCCSPGTCGGTSRSDEDAEDSDDDVAEDDDDDAASLCSSSLTLAWCCRHSCSPGTGGTLLEALAETETSEHRSSLGTTCSRGQGGVATCVFMFEHETKVAEDYAKFYNHGEGPY